MWKWLRLLPEHEIHHRGQIYTYHGILGVATPPLYGLTSEQVVRSERRRRVASGGALAYHSRESPVGVGTMLDKDFNVLCPCCQTKILVDHKTGAVISHQEPTKGRTKTFEEAVSENKRRRSEAEDLFAQAVREHENREELLEKKFKEAFEKAEKDPNPPPRPFDYD